MATVNTSCPKCKKQIKVPAEVVGKKIKCKNCGNIFAAAATSFKSADPDAKEKAGAPDIFKTVDDDEGDGKPYDVTTLDLTPRCPHCANEMEADDIICLACGYNTETRQLGATRRVKDVSGEDWFWWLLPPILAILLFFTCFGELINVILGYVFTHEEKYAQYATDYGDMAGFARSCYQCCCLWISIFCLWVMWLTGKYAFLRLVYSFRPPEKELH
jgi:DNA-directed RNA polymerase subunit M/transcription elongation factor TFIIS